MNARVVAIVQARVASSRLPGKVLADIGGQPMLVRVVERVANAHRLNHILVATSNRDEDDPIADLCRRRGLDCYRGHPTDLLDRYWSAAQVARAQVVVRVTADCPLLDPALLDAAVEAFLTADPPLDFVANRLPRNRTYPIGLDIEVCSIAALRKAWREADQPHQREHVMPYLYEEPERFNIRLLHADRDFGDLRWTVDTSEDLQFVREVYRQFAPRTDFGWHEILDLLAAKPEIAAINSAVPHKTERDVDPRRTKPW